MATQNQDQAVLKNQYLYDFENPDLAFTNALKDVGINAYAANPFVQRMRRFAPGLSTAFLQQEAGNRQDFGDNPGTESSKYANFLRDALRTGDVVGESTRALSNFGTAIDRVRTYRERQASGQNVGEINPYLAALSEQLGADDGEGTTRAILGLAAPRMSSGMARAYGGGLQAAHTGALRRLAESPNMYNEDIWKYLMNSRGGVF